MKKFVKEWFSPCIKGDGSVDYMELLSLMFVSILLMSAIIILFYFVVSIFTKGGG